MRALLLALLLVPLPTAVAHAGDDVQVHALAVAATANGLVGNVASVRIHQEKGTGLVLLDTQPFAQVDLQGSARLAVRVAAEVAGVDAAARDFRFVVRSDTTLIGGPSGGAILTVGAIAALRGWSVAPDAYMTGTIAPDGSIGPVGGVPEKASAAAARGGRLFLYPVGEEEVMTLTPQGRVRVNMTQHCERLGIECRAVLDVYDALPLLTGYAIERPPLPDASAAARYLDALTPLAAVSVANATRTIELLDMRLNASSSVDHPYFPNAARAAERAREALDEATAAQAQRLPYAATSRAFLAQVLARQAALTLDVIEAEDPRVKLDEQASLLANATRDALDAAKAARDDTPTRMEAAAAAQQRATYANQSLALAAQAIRRQDLANALFQLAYGMERAATVRWWLDTAELFPSNATVDARQRALAAIGAASEQLAYATATLEGAGATQLLANAQASLDLARERYNDGQHAAAAYDALDAQVRASLALETLAYGDEVPQARLDRARAEAERAIARARARGIEPLLAATQLENGDTLEGTERLAAYELARLVAASHAPDPRVASAQKVATPGWTLTPLGWAGAYASVGFLLGGASVAAFLTARAKAQRAPTSQPAQPAQGPVAAPAEEEAIVPVPEPAEEEAAAPAPEPAVSSTSK